MPRYPRLSLFWLVAALALIPACRQGDDVFYRIETPPVELRPGTGGKALIRFVAADGYHWNAEYPARFRVADAGGLTVAIRDLDRKHFRDEAGVGVLALPVKGAMAARTRMKGTASFSVCNPKECRILKGIEVEVPVHVR